MSSSNSTTITPPTVSTTSTSPIPVSVFTGFLGSGKTTLILSLLQRLPKDYNVVLLKNEFGDVKVDSELVQFVNNNNNNGGSGKSNIGVAEMLNGCLCCVLVGQMKNALLEIKEKYAPDRIIIETSGSAFPAPISWQIRELEPEGFALDSIITVIDCINFRGYADTSYTAKLQAQYTDVILLNKWELVTERELDLVVDHVNTLNDCTPKVRCEGMNGVSPDLVFGLDTSLFVIQNGKEMGSEETKWRELMDSKHQDREVDLLQILKKDVGEVLVRETFETFLNSLNKEDVYRVKGFVRLRSENMAESGLYILNWAFGRFTLTPVNTATEFADETTNSEKEGLLIKVTVMGQGLSMYRKKIAEGFGVGMDEVVLHAAHRH